MWCRGENDRNTVRMTMLPDLLVNDLTVQLPAAVRLQRVVVSLQAEFKADAVALLRMDGGEAACLRPLAAVGLSRDALGRRFQLSQHPRLAAIASRHEVVSFPSDSTLPDPYDGLVVGHPGQALPVHDCMGIRLQQEGRTWGVLTLDGLSPGRFTDAQRQRLARTAPLVEAAVRTSRLEQENHELRHLRARAQRASEDKGALAFGSDDLEIVAHSETMRALLDESDLVAQSDLPVLLLGETGVGKELFARRLHRLSARQGRALVQVNCAALPESLAESELFGHVRGAYSGAAADRAGRVEAAEGGTLFLDEVGELPLALQAKLLRTLQNGEIQRLGSDRARKVDVRVVSATNRDLRAAVRDGQFRSDLYHRLSVYPFPIPPLRERHDDILPLAGRFLELNRARLGLRGLRLAVSAEQALLAYGWPGNVRELEHVIGRAALRAAGRSDARDRIVAIGLDLLGLDTGSAGSRRVEGNPGDPVAAAPFEGLSPRGAARHAQSLAVERAVADAHGNWAMAARALGMDASNLHKLARRLGLK